MLYEKEADKKYYFYLGVRDYCNLKFDTQPHCHDSVELFVLKNGSLDVTVNGQNKTLTGKAIVFTDSYDIHSYRSTNCEGCVLVFSKEYCRLLAESDYTFENFIDVSDDVFTKIVTAIDAFARCQGANDNKFYIESLAAYVFGTLLKSGNTVKKVEDKTKNVMVKVLNYVNKNYKNDLTMPSVAAEFGYTSNYFSKLFNDFTKTTFTDYLNYVRYKNAYEILRDKENVLSVTEVALSCGFGSMNTFYRTRKKFDV